MTEDGQGAPVGTGRGDGSDYGSGVGNGTGSGHDHCDSYGYGDGYDHGLCDGDGSLSDARVAALFNPSPNDLRAIVIYAHIFKEIQQ